MLCSELRRQEYDDRIGRVEALGILVFNNFNIINSRVKNLKLLQVSNYLYFRKLIRP